MERYFFYLARHLAKLGVEVEVVASKIKDGAQKAEMDGVKFTFLPPDMSNKTLMHALYWKFNSNVMHYLEAQKFDLLHGCGGIYPYILKHERKPVVYQPFGLEPLKSENLVKRAFYYLFNYGPSKKRYDNADAIASEGDVQTQEMIDMFNINKEKVFNLPDGVDLGEVRKFIDSSCLTRADIGLNNNELVLINVNRLAKNKGVTYLIDALKLLKGEYNAKLILVGSGPEEKRIKQQIERLGLKDNVVHFKNIPDEKMYQLFTLADVSITPTLYEGLPLVVLEAMAAGKPIVATNVSEVPQVIKNGINGLLVPPKDPKAMAMAVQKICDEKLQKKFGDVSMEIIKNYDWKNIALTALDKYKSLIKQGSKWT